MKIKNMDHPLPLNSTRPKRQLFSYIIPFAGLLVLMTILWMSIKDVGSRTIQFEPEPSFNFFALLVSIALSILIHALFIASKSAMDALRHTHLRTAAKEDVDYREIKDFTRHKKYYGQICAIGDQASRTLLIFLGLALVPICTRWMQSIWDIPTTWGILFISSIILILPLMMLDLIFGEMIPRIYGEAYPYRTLKQLKGFLKISAVLFGFIGKAVAQIVALFTRSVEEKKSLILSSPTEEEIKTLVETAQETGEIKPPERKLIHSVFEFTDLVARQIMTPRVDLDTLSVAADPRDAVKLIESSGHSRIPIYEGTDDQIIGIVHVKDLLLNMLHFPTQTNLHKLMRMPLFIPENKNLYQLLQEMRFNRVQMAIVQDEFGGTAGIVTIEDIVEELVGEIVDEYDTEEPSVVGKDKGYVVDGRLSLNDLNEAIHSEFESDEFETIAGYVFGLFGRQPKMEEQLESEGYRFMVMETDGRRILKIYIEKIPNEDELQKTNKIES